MKHFTLQLHHHSYIRTWGKVRKIRDLEGVGLIHPFKNILYAVIFFLSNLSPTTLFVVGQYKECTDPTLYIIHSSDQNVGTFTEPLAGAIFGPRMGQRQHRLSSLSQQDHVNFLCTGANTFTHDDDDSYSSICIYYTAQPTKSTYKIIK